jgi:hypothetical protein
MGSNILLLLKTISVGALLLALVMEKSFKFSCLIISKSIFSSVILSVTLNKLSPNETSKPSGYSGSFCATDFGWFVPVISVQIVPFFSIMA